MCIPAPVKSSYGAFPLAELKMNPSADRAVPSQRTIPDLLDVQAAQRPDALFAIFPNAEITFGALRRDAAEFARGLLGLGLRPGDHVAILMPNCRDFLTPYYACLMLGIVVVALNARYKRHELAYAIKHSDSKALITTDEIAEHTDFVDLLQQTLPELKQGGAPFEAAPALRSPILLGATAARGFLTRDDVVRQGEGVTVDAFENARTTVAPESTAVILYTSGTTAAPKACELTHRSIQASWRTFSDLMDFKAGEKLWTPMPLFHTGGIGPMTAALACGAAFMTMPHADANTVLELVERYRIEHLYAGFPQLSLPIVESPSFTAERFGFVRSMLNVGPEPMQRHIQSRLPPGAVLLNLFGMTEGSGIVTFTPPDEPLDVRATSSGRAPADTEVRIVDPDTGLPCQSSVPGEIQFRGPRAFKRYYKNEEATRATILPDGWVRTGDRGRLEGDGQLYFMGRIKDVLKVGGENVGALEIESFLLKHPAVTLAQVIGAPDARLGEVPIAFIERAAGADVTESDLLAFCDGQLARWKIPRRVFFITEWPMSSTKIQKFRLRELLPADLRSV